MLSKFTWCQKNMGKRHPMFHLCFKFPSYGQGNFSTYVWPEIRYLKYMHTITGSRHHSKYNERFLSVLGVKFSTKLEPAIFPPLTKHGFSIMTYVKICPLFLFFFNPSILEQLWTFLTKTVKQCKTLFHNLPPILVFDYLVHPQRIWRSSKFFSQPAKQKSFLMLVLRVNGLNFSLGGTKSKVMRRSDTWLKLTPPPPPLPQNSSNILECQYPQNILSHHVLKCWVMSLE